MIWINIKCVYVYFNAMILKLRKGENFTCAQNDLKLFVGTPTHESATFIENHLVCGL